MPKVDYMLSIVLFKLVAIFIPKLAFVMLVAFMAANIEVLFKLKALLFITKLAFIVLVEFVAVVAFMAANIELIETAVVFVA